MARRIRGNVYVRCRGGENPEIESKGYLFLSLFQPKAASDIASKVKLLGGDIWCYTGFTYEDLVQTNSSDIKKLLYVIDVLVDGPFILEQKDPLLSWRGSINQRILKLKEGVIVGTVG